MKPEDLKEEIVVAIRDANDEEKVVNIYGFGRYKGDFIPKSGETVVLDRPNPAIAIEKTEVNGVTYELNQGKLVWGLMCWWGATDLSNYTEKGFTINEVPVDINLEIASEEDINMHILVESAKDEILRAIGTENWYFKLPKEDTDDLHGAAWFGECVASRDGKILVPADKYINFITSKIKEEYINEKEKEEVE